MENTLTPPRWSVQHMYRRYKGPLDKRYRVCTIEAILDNCFTEVVFCGLIFFFFYEWEQNGHNVPFLESASLKK